MSLSQTVASQPVTHKYPTQPQARPPQPPMVNIWRLNLMLVVFIATLWTFFVFQHGRKIRFLLSRDVEVQGMVLRLDPKDDTITLDILDHGNYEPGETAVLRDVLKPGDTFVDVGANIGWYTVVASRIVGPEGRVIAFEPAPRSFELLRDNVRINGCRNVDLEAKALSNEQGRLELNLGNTNKGHNSFLRTPETRESVLVQTVRFDDYLKRHPRKVDVMKIDVEGAEGFVLGGMIETLHANPRVIILMEYQPRLLRQAGFDPTSLLEMFSKSGYEIRVIDKRPGPLKPVPENEVAALTDDLERDRTYVNLLLKPRS